MIGKFLFSLLTVLRLLMDIPSEFADSLSAQLLNAFFVDGAFDPVFVLASEISGFGIHIRRCKGGLKLSDAVQQAVDRHPAIARLEFIALYDKLKAKKAKSDAIASPSKPIAPVSTQFSGDVDPEWNVNVPTEVSADALWDELTSKLNKLMDGKVSKAQVDGVIFQLEQDYPADHPTKQILLAIMSLPPSASSVESFFSVTDCVVTERRTRLANPTVREIMCTKYANKEWKLRPSKYTVLYKDVRDQPSFDAYWAFVCEQWQGLEPTLLDEAFAFMNDTSGVVYIPLVELKPLPSHGTTPPITGICTPMKPVTVSRSTRSKSISEYSTPLGFVLQKMYYADLIKLLRQFHGKKDIPANTPVDILEKDAIIRFCGDGPESRLQKFRDLCLRIAPDVYFENVTKHCVERDLKKSDDELSYSLYDDPLFDDLPLLGDDGDLPLLVDGGDDGNDGDDDDDGAALKTSNMEPILVPHSPPGSPASPPNNHHFGWKFADSLVVFDSLSPSNTVKLTKDCSRLTETVCISTLVVLHLTLSCFCGTLVPTSCPNTKAHISRTASASSTPI